MGNASVVRSIAETESRSCREVSDESSTSFRLSHVSASGCLVAAPGRTG